MANLEKTHIYHVMVCLMLFVDDDECLKTPPVCDINANCKNTLGSYLCSCKEGFKGDGKTCQGKIKKKNGTIQETPHVTYWSKNFYIARSILIPLISNGHLITLIKKRFRHFLCWGKHEAVGISFVNWIFISLTNNHKLIIADNNNDIDTADDDNDDDVKEIRQDINYFSGV